MVLARRSKECPINTGVEVNPFVVKAIFVIDENFFIECRAIFKSNLDFKAYVWTFLAPLFNTLYITV